MFGYSFLLKFTESGPTDLQAVFPFGDSSHERWREKKRFGGGGGWVSGLGGGVREWAFPCPWQQAARSHVLVQLAPLAPWNGELAHRL